MTDPDLRFDAAINPYGCSPRVVEALERAARARAYRHYGDADAAALRRRLADRFDLPPECFLVYNGSGDAFVWQCLSRLMMPGGTFIHPAPSYERFVEIGARCARRVIAVPLEEPSWRLDAERFTAEARAAGATLAMISSPNNPTGNRLVDEPTLEALLEGLPDCTILVDEAYAEYTGQSFAPLVRRHPNLVVLKTFSKAYGLAGLRVGYAVGHERLIAAARRFQIPWAVDSLALTAAEAALEDEAYLSTIIATILQDRAALGRGLGALRTLRVHPSDANFFLVDLVGVGYDHQVAPALARRGIVVRRRPDMPDRIRVTSMMPAANAALLGALAEVGS